MKHKMDFPTDSPISREDQSLADFHNEISRIVKKFATDLPENERVGDLVNLKDVKELGEEERENWEIYKKFAVDLLDIVKNRDVEQLENKQIELEQFIKVIKTKGDQYRTPLKVEGAIIVEENSKSAFYDWLKNKLTIPLNAMDIFFEEYDALKARELLENEINSLLK